MAVGDELGESESNAWTQLAALGIQEGMLFSVERCMVLSNADDCWDYDEMLVDPGADDKREVHEGERL